MEETTETNLLADENFELDQYVYATQGQRFLNWLIDNLLMRFGLAFVSGVGFSLILAAISPELLQKIANSSDRFSGPVLVFSFFVGYFNYIVYYTLCEKLFKGYTLGKLITGTKAIRQDGQELTFKDALLRSLSRCVPFEVFSGFSTLTWHDSWTDTMVVKAR
jgi:uncharacterized RDD family membrane protein YckC